MSKASRKERVSRKVEKRGCIVFPNGDPRSFAIALKDEKNGKIEQCANFYSNGLIKLGPVGGLRGYKQDNPICCTAP